MAGYQMSRFLLGKDMAQERNKIEDDMQSASKRNEKSGFWQSIGGTLGGILLPVALGLTGPVGLGLGAAAGSLGGGLLGRAGAGGMSKGANFKQGNFYQNDRRRLIDQLATQRDDATESMITNALKSGVMGGALGMDKPDIASNANRDIGDWFMNIFGTKVNSSPEAAFNRLF